MKNTKTLVMYALLIAIILLMGFTPLGYLKIGFVEITFITIPVIVGAIAAGPLCGTVLGGVFGLTSFFQAFGMSAFGVQLMAINPLYTFIVCFFPRLLMGFLCGLIFKAIKSKASFVIASLAGALLNTILFMSALILFFGNSEYIKTMMQTLGGTLIQFLIGFVGINGLIEAIVCAFVGSAVSIAVCRTIKNKY